MSKNKSFAKGLLVGKAPKLLSSAIDVIQSEYPVQMSVESNYCKGISHIMRQKPDFLVTIESICSEEHSGFSLVSRTREALNIPIIMYFEDYQKEKRFKAFRSGADDVVMDACDEEEVTYRITQLLSRHLNLSSIESSTYHVDDLKIDSRSNTVLLGDSPIALTQTEKELLNVLVKFKGEYLSKPYLQMLILKRPYSQHDRSIDMHVSNLRRKLSKSGHPSHKIFAVRGYGYCYR